MKKLLLIGFLLSTPTVFCSNQYMMPPQKFARANQIKFNPIDDFARSVGLDQKQDVLIIEDLAKEFKPIIKEAIEKMINKLNVALDHISPEGIEKLIKQFDREILSLFVLRDMSKNVLKTKDDLKNALQTLKEFTYKAIDQNTKK